MCELDGISFITPETSHANCSLSALKIIILPIGSASLKYFFAIRSVITTLFGASKTLSGSPFTSSKSNTLKKR